MQKVRYWCRKMALIYEKFAIVSVGLSCQVAHQIYNHKDYIDDLVGETSLQKRTQFDWLVAPANAITQQLAQDCFFPETSNELTHMAKGKIFYWERMQSWFFHAKDVKQDFDYYTSKFRHMSNMLKQYSDRKIIAIWSNAQINMEPETTVPPLDNLCRQSDLVGLAAALHQLNPTSELIPVVRNSRIDPSDPPPEKGYIPYDIDDEPDNWRGSDEAWQDIFTLIFNRDHAKVAP